MHELTEMTIREMQGSTSEKHYLIAVGDNFLEGNSLTADLLSTIKEAETVDEGVREFVAKYHERYSETQIKELLKDKILPGLFEKKKNRQFYFQKVLISGEAIMAYSQGLSFLFKPAIMKVVLLVALLLDVFFFLTNDSLVVYNDSINAFVVLCLIVLMVISSLLHEIGHAAACRYFGVSHGDIGFGMYLNFPVFFTDVTGIWVLPRIQRCVVNIAGVYFQCILLIFAIMTYIFFPYFLIRYFVLVLNLGFLVTLNPFFKFDGYWLVSDTLGIPNLRQRGMEVVSYYFHRLRGREWDRPIPYLLMLKRSSKVGMLLYALLVNLFMAYYFIYVIPLFVYRFIKSFPGEIHELVLYLSSNIMPPFALLKNIFSQLVFFAILAVFIMQLFYRHKMRS